MRLPSIDLLRALAIVAMVVVHFVENLSGQYPAAGTSGPIWLPAGLAAPLFTFLSGTSYRLWVERQRDRGRDEETITRITVRRALLLFGTGIAFNVLVWLPEETFNWDILTLVATALFVLAAVRQAPAFVPVAACGIALAVSPVVRQAVDYPAYWNDGFFAHDFSLGDVLLGFLAVGYFPVLPWIALPLAGYAAAPGLLGATAAGRPTRTPVVAGTVLVVVAALMLVGRSALPAGWQAEATWTMFPPATAYLIGTLGGAILALAALHATIDGTARPGAAPGDGWAAVASRHALSIYLLHHVVHLWPLWAAGTLLAGEPTALWQRALPPWAALGLALAFLVAVVPLLRRLDRAAAPTAESVMRWLCD